MLFNMNYLKVISILFMTCKNSQSIFWGTILFLYLLGCSSSVPGAFAKSKTRPGLLPASQTNNAANTRGKGYDVESQGKQQQNNDKTHRVGAGLKRLKKQLLLNYDPTIFPRYDNSSNNIRVKVGFTYRQVLDLDEKNQVLKSLVWFRMSWIDPQLSWDSKEFEGIKKIELPHNQVWRPDIMVYEEIGVRDYSPRLQRIKIFSNGEVDYREPTVFETTCRIDTAFFPFDIQVCHLTFVSWTESAIDIDLVCDREPCKLLEDAETYFVNTGEWKLVGLTVKKVVKDYEELLEMNPVTHVQSSRNNNSMRGSNHSADEMVSNEQASYNQNIDRKHFQLHSAQYPMPAQSPTNYTTLGNHSIKSTMFAEVKFTLVIRRNSSLYMQSMLFPSILLTTVAILGFYLPPDSGERIGLQITILLTFMVFLLAVGEMFPASTGPYLGIYFVLCMALLGVNLAMTVLVLHIHFKPVIILEKAKYFDKKTSKTCNTFGCHCCPAINDGSKSTRKYKSVIPRSLRSFLRFCNRYWSLREYNAKWLKDDNDGENDSSNFGSSEEDLISENDATYVASFDHKQKNHQKVNSSRKHPSVDNLTKESNHNTTHGIDNYEPHLTVPNVACKMSAKQRYSIPLLNVENDNLRADEIESTFDLKTADNDHVHPPVDAENRSCNNEATVWDRLNERKRLYPTDAASPSSNQLTPIPILSRSANDVPQLIRENEVAGNILKPPTNNKGGSTVFRRRVFGVLNEIQHYVKKNEKKSKKLLKQRKEQQRKLKKEKNQEKEEMFQEEWKSVARAIDILCFRVYVILILIGHSALFIAAFKTWLDSTHLHLPYNE